MSFDDLGLSAPVLKAIKDCGYDTPTPIQAQAIPPILMTRDVVGIAQTGTGKTASFTLPMIEILAGGRVKARMPRSLVLTPTRELAAQVAENFDTYGVHTELKMALLTGGVSMDEQIKKLERGVDVLIATPGRLLDLFGRGNILLNDIKILVIDEADRMLDMGFIPDIEKIIGYLPPLRQTLLFSATMPGEIRKLTKKFLSNPKEISVSAPATTAKTVEQFLVWTDPRSKKKDLARIMQREKVESAFIFCNRKRDIGALCSFLKKEGYAAAELHGDMAQSERTKTLQAFKDGQVNILVCSDVAGRGLDVQGLSHVFNYDVPNSSDDYVHRIGRTGRAGKDGRAWTLAVKDDAKAVSAIEKHIRNPIDVFKFEGENSKPSGKPQETKKKSASRESKKEKRPGPPNNPSKSSSNQKYKGKNASDHRDDNDDSQGFGDHIPSFFGSGKG